MAELSLPAHDLDRARASNLMAQDGLDAIVAQSPENFYYATGHRAWAINLYRRAGFGAAVVPADPAAGAGAVVADVDAGHFRRTTAGAFPHVREYAFWVAFCEVDPSRASDDVCGALHAASTDKPRDLLGQVDRQATIQEVAGVIREMGLSERRRIGIELGFMSADTFGWLRDLLPGVTWVDCGGLLAELRMLKNPREVARLKTATELTEAGIAGAIAHRRRGVTARELVRAYERAILNEPRVTAEAVDLGMMRLSLRLGPNVMSAEAYGPHPLVRGDLLFLDAGVEVAGYRSDMGRTAVYGAPTDSQKTVHEALLAGQLAARDLLRPGTPSSEIFWAGQRAIWQAGLESYVRGNVGHGIGMDAAPELPIISKEDPHVLAPGMVISVEFPYYVHGLGAFQVEDTYLITKAGAERWTMLPDQLVELD
ncbi:MAG: Xaa-Pro peptidase family protein [Chloroflexota bacterium]